MDIPILLIMAVFLISLVGLVAGFIVLKTAIMNRLDVPPETMGQDILSNEKKVEPPRSSIAIPQTPTQTSVQSGVETPLVIKPSTPANNTTVTTPNISTATPQTTAASSANETQITPNEGKIAS